MRKIVTDEMITAAVEHCQKNNQNPSRGRVMDFMSRQENGGCAGDPENVGKMIRAHLASLESSACVPATAGESSGGPLPARLEAALAKASEGLSGTMCSLYDVLSVELAGVKAELAGYYDQLVGQVRRDSDQAMESAMCDEQDALNALGDALEHKATLDGELEQARAEFAGAAAVANERGVQVRELEAIAERQLAETTALVAGLRSDLDAARGEARESSALLRERSARIADFESTVTSLQEGLSAARQDAAAARAVAEERTTRIVLLEGQLAAAPVVAGTCSQEAEILPRSDDPDPEQVDTRAGDIGHRNGGHKRAHRKTATKETALSATASEGPQLTAGRDVHESMPGLAEASE